MAGSEANTVGRDRRLPGESVLKKSRSRRKSPAVSDGGIGIFPAVSAAGFLDAAMESMARDLRLDS